MPTNHTHARPVSARFAPGKSTICPRCNASVRLAGPCRPCESWREVAPLYRARFDAEPDYPGDSEDDRFNRILADDLTEEARQERLREFYAKVNGWCPVITVVVMIALFSWIGGCQ